MKIYKNFDIVVVPFPFTDSLMSKNRPAVVLSSKDMFNKKINHSILAMITSAQHSPWPLDTPIHNLESCGLKKPSIIRLKLFALDNRIIKDMIGILNIQDQKRLKQNIKLLFEM